MSNAFHDALRVLFARRRPEHAPPYVLTDPIKPTPDMWVTANRIHNHPKPCRCSTCTLTANLGATVRAQREEKPDGDVEPGHKGAASPVRTRASGRGGRDRP